MAEGILADREKALEELFFEKQNRKLVEQLRAEREQAEAREGLAALTGIENDALIESLVGLELRPETWAALSLLPLVEVAWADGNVDDKERQAVLSAAEANGVGRGSASRELLESWLAERPASGYLEAWGASMVEICAHLQPEERETMRREVTQRARRVAEATGGFLGLGNRISPDEQRVLDDLDKAFAR